MSDASSNSNVAKPPPLPRYMVIGAVVGGILVLFAATGGWLTPDALTPARFVDTFQQLSGVHPGFRRNHAKGVCVTGYFESNGKGAELCKASVFQAGRVPVIGRFSLSGRRPASGARFGDLISTYRRRRMALGYGQPARFSRAHTANVS